MSGSEIHANILATLHDRAFIHQPPWPITLALLVVFGMFLGRVLGFLNLTAGFLLMTAHHLAWKLTVPVVFGYFDVRLELVSMLTLGFVLYALTFSLRWRRLRNMLGVIKSEAIARLLENDPSQLDLRGEERLVTVLFADIRGFGQFSKQHSPPEVMALLNAYFTAIVPVIEAHGGTLNQYMGDGCMVLFNAPFACPQHALQAVRAARAVVPRVAELRSTWTALDCPHFAIGIGIHTGPVIVGSVGSSRRLDYTALGETTNNAVRIEAQTKHFGVAILISAATYHDLPAKERERLGCCREAQRAEEKEARMEVHIVQAPEAGEKAT